MLALFTNKYFLGAAAVVGLVVGAYWYRGVVFDEGVAFGQNEVKLAVNSAKEKARAESKKKADALEATAKSDKAKLQAEIRSLRDVKDTTACYNTIKPADNAKRMRDAYDSYNK